MLKLAIDMFLRWFSNVALNCLFSPIFTETFDIKSRKFIGTSLKMNNIHLLKMSGSPLNSLMYVTPLGCLIPKVPLGKLK